MVDTSGFDYLIGNCLRGFAPRHQLEEN